MKRRTVGARQRPTAKAATGSRKGKATTGPAVALPARDKSSDAEDEQQLLEREVESLVRRALNGERVGDVVRALPADRRKIFWRLHHKLRGTAMRDALIAVGEHEKAAFPMVVNIPGSESPPSLEILAGAEPSRARKLSVEEATRPVWYQQIERELEGALGALGHDVARFQREGEDMVLARLLAHSERVATKEARDAAEKFRHRMKYPVSSGEDPLPYVARAYHLLQALQIREAKWRYADEQLAAASAMVETPEKTPWPEILRQITEEQNGPASSKEALRDRLRDFMPRDAPPRWPDLQGRVKMGSENDESGTRDWFVWLERIGRGGDDHRMRRRDVEELAREGGALTDRPARKPSGKRQG